MLEPIIFINSSRVLALTTTRTGGVSLPPFDSLNFAYQTSDNFNHVKDNRDLFFRSLSINPNDVTYTYQSHSDVIAKVTYANKGKGVSSFEDGIVADALYTLESKTPLAVFHADCVPVFIYHRLLPLVGVIHAGTEGTLKKITLKSLITIIQNEKLNPNDLFVQFGPSLDFAHHPISIQEVDRLVALDANYAQAIKVISGTFYLDIPLLNYMQTIDAGIPIDNIQVSLLDTYSNPQTFFSYQREKVTGRHISLILLK
jgi:YfiH family protein